MKRLALVGLVAGVLAMFPIRAVATVPPEGGGSGDTVPAPTTTLPSGVTTTVSVEDEGAPSPATPVGGVSAPLIVIPTGCPQPPVAAIVFVGHVLVKDRRTARFHVDQIRAGSGDAYMVDGLIDVRYDDDVKFLVDGQQYLVGAAPKGASQVLTSRVRADKPLFGGNDIIGLAQKTVTCPVVEDPVRTLHVDGTPVPSGVLTGLHGSGRKIVLAFLVPLAVAIGIILALAALRWLFTAIFVSARKAAHAEPLRVRHTEVRRRIE